MRLIVIYFSFHIVSICGAFAQNNSSDDITKKIVDFAKQLKTSSNRYDLFEKLSRDLYIWYDKSDSTTTSVQEIHALHRVAQTYKILEVELLTQLAKAYVYAFRDKNIIALGYVERAIAQAKKHKRQSMHAYLYRILGRLQQRFGNDKAIKTLLKSYEMFLAMKKNGEAAESLYWAALMQYNSDVKTSIKIETFKKVIELGKNSAHYHAIIDSYNAIGLLHTSSKKYKQAEKWLTKAMKLSIEAKDSAWIGILSGNFSQVYEGQKNYDKALKYLQVDLKFSKKYKKRYSLTLVYASMGHNYFMKKKHDLSKAYYDSCIINSKVDYYKFVGDSTIYYPALMLGYKGLAKLYATKKQFENAYKYRTLANIAKDTLNHRRLHSKVNQIQSAYNLDKKQKEVLLLTKENDLKTATIQRQNLFNIAIGIGLFLVLILMIVIYRSAQMRKRKNHQLKAQQNEIMTQNEELFQQQEEILAQQEFVENQNKELSRKNLMIHQSIKSAQLIQAAILPYESKLNNLLKDYFIIFRPKDIVSGDFYWLNKIENKTILIAADCTGHGVPGAFMSLICNTLFDKIIRVWNITEPAEVLKKAQSEIRVLLRQQELGYANGMDVCLVTVEEITESQQVKVVFAGAKRPLYYIKKGVTNLHEIRGTNLSIGGRERKDKPSFTQTELLLDKTSVLYLGSDGYGDQNNKKRKSYTAKSLKLLLEKIASKPMNEQKKILDKTLKQHMEGTEQRDDIMLIGVRLL